jgi:aminoglycoside phosphotransferase (APT) family kinase protein
MHETDAHLRHDAHALGSALAPAIVEACQGRLSRIEWFQSSWQRGGAATGFATYERTSGERVPVMVKVPVGPDEYRWTNLLAHYGSEHPEAPTPRVLASGTGVGGHDLAWLVIERLTGQTLHQGWCRESLEDLLRAAAQMQALAQASAAIEPRAERHDWEQQIERARRVARESSLPEAQHWKESEKKVRRVLPHLVGLWAMRPINTWCHGDLHPGNAMRRETGSGRAACVLIDLALVHPGHWIEDAIYLERQFWGKPEALFGVHAVSTLARFRREAGLKTDGDYGLLANVRRVLMAACAPAHLAAEGNPRYLHAALETIDRVLPQVAHAH